MKECPHCHHINPDDLIICDECTTILNPGEDNFDDGLKKRIDSGVLDEFRNIRKADIMFVFDCTSSMTNEIRAMQDAIIEFAQAVKAEGLDIRLGLIEFRDRLYGEEHILHNFSGEVFTTDMNAFKIVVDKLQAIGGGPPPESSPDALMLALKQKFRKIPNKTIVLITDAPPNLPDKSTRSYDDVIAQMEKKDINQFYLVTMLKYKKCLVHLQVLEGVCGYGGDGLAFELSKKDDQRKNHFKQILMGLAKSISAKSV